MCTPMPAVDPCLAPGQRALLGAAKARVPALVAGTGTGLGQPAAHP